MVNIKKLIQIAMGLASVVPTLLAIITALMPDENAQEGNGCSAMLSLTDVQRAVCCAGNNTV